MVADVFQNNPNYLTILHFAWQTKESGNFLAGFVLGVLSAEFHSISKTADEPGAACHPHPLRTCLVFLVYRRAKAQEGIS